VCCRLRQHADVTLHGRLDAFPRDIQVFASFGVKKDVQCFALGHFFDTDEIF